MTYNPIVESILDNFKVAIGEDFLRYKNHVQRVVLNCNLLDDDPGNQEKYAIAAVFHDIGIWTDHTFDYLAPSETQASIYLSSVGKTDWIPEITAMIHWHHKSSEYQAEYAQTVETFRKSDWIDVSLGLLRYGASSEKISQYKKELPNLGFHWFLVRSTFRNFLKYPTKPLPMFTR